MLDENDNPSRPRNVLVIIKNFEGTFPGGVILNVRPDDPDIKGNYQCQLINGPENIFVVNQDCSVKGESYESFERKRGLAKYQSQSKVI